MAAGQGFKTFTTGEVLSASDVNGYLMQGVLVFASAAARDAAITSPQEGQFAYLKDTNVTTYYTGSAWANVDSTGMTNPMTTTGDTIYSSSGSTPARLGIGSTGQVLTVASGIPSWATPGGGSMTLLSTTTLSGTSTTISSIDQTYQNLVFIIRNLAVSATCSVTFQANGNNSAGFFTGKVYTSGVNLADVAMNPDGNAASVGTNFTMGGVIQINNYTDTATGSWKPAYGNGVLYTTSPGAKAAWAQAGGWYTASAISSMKFATSGSETLTGTILTYGVK